jgi:hypothetical protein
MDRTMQCTGLHCRCVQYSTVSGPERLVTPCPVSPFQSRSRSRSGSWSSSRSRPGAKTLFLNEMHVPYNLVSRLWQYRSACMYHGCALWAACDMDRPL